MAWRKTGNRFYRKDQPKFNAVIFGAPSPTQLWAWAVWSHQKRREGMEFSLKQARSKANSAIIEAGEETHLRTALLEALKRLAKATRNVLIQFRDFADGKECDTALFHSADEARFAMAEAEAVIQKAEGR